MKRRFLIALLGFGTFFGFASGFASMGAHWQHHHQQRRAAFEAHVADVCVDAARRDHAERTDRPDAPDPRADRGPRQHARPDFGW